MKTLRISTFLILAASFFLSSGCSHMGKPKGAVPIQEHWKKLIILHTNDVHGQVLPLPATWLKDRDPLPDSGGVARLAAYVKMVREQAIIDGDEVLVVDAGDWFQGTPEGGLDDGLPFMKILAAVGYDAMAVGNHEFDHGVKILEQHLMAAKLPALLANTSEPSGRLLQGTSPYMIVERAGMRIAVVGLLTLDTPSITHHSASTLHWVEPAQVLSSLIQDLQKEGDVDWILPLTHMGFAQDQELVAQVPGLPLVIGGHSHTLLAHGKLIGETWIVQAGSKARGIGRVEVWIDPATRSVELITPTVVNLYEETTAGFHNPEVERLSDLLVKRGDEFMSVIVGQLNADLKRGKSKFHTSSQGNWVTDVMRSATGADVALQNRGGLRSNLEAGPISRRDVFRMLPFNNTLIVLTMPGRDLEALLRRTVEGERPVTLEMSGMRVNVQKTGASWKMNSLTIAGEPVAPERMYKVATNSFMAGGGDGFTEFTFIKERTEGGLIQRDLVEQNFQAADSGISPSREDRYLHGSK